MSAPYRYHVFPCAGPRCTPEQGERFKGLLKQLCPDRKALGIRISTSSCQGMCELGPNLTVYPEGIAYHGLREGDIERIVEEHLRGGCPVQEILQRPVPAGDKNGDK
jgi:(2Fe-2S) ferredoxin